MNVRSGANFDRRQQSFGCGRRRSRHRDVQRVSQRVVAMLLPFSRRKHESYRANLNPQLLAAIATWKV